MSSKIVIKEQKATSHRTKRINKVNPFQNGDASKINWKDHEHQADAAQRNLHELFPGVFIDQGEVEMINFLLANYAGRITRKRLLVTRAIEIAETKTASGLVVDSNEYDGKFGGKHEQELPPHLRPSSISVVISVGDDNQDNLQRGDVIRFNPIEQKSFVVVKHRAYNIHELDVQTIEGNVYL